MNKTEVLNIVNEPSKHIQIVKIDGKDSIVYSSKFVELLELIPNMLTKADMMAMLTEIQLKIEKIPARMTAITDSSGLICYGYSEHEPTAKDASQLVQAKINQLRSEE